MLTTDPACYGLSEATWVATDAAWICWSLDGAVVLVGICSCCSLAVLTTMRWVFYAMMQLDWSALWSSTGSRLETRGGQRRPLSGDHNALRAVERPPSSSETQEALSGQQSLRPEVATTLAPRPWGPASHSLARPALHIRPLGFGASTQFVAMRPSQALAALLCCSTGALALQQPEAERMSRLRQMEGQLQQMLSWRQGWELMEFAGGCCRPDGVSKLMAPAACWQCLHTS